MANQESFIDEVSEEVRRDKLYAMMRRYGWIAVLLVILVVGGAAFFEWQKAKSRAEAQATGDVLIDALSLETADERAAALAAVPSDDDPAKNAVLTLLKSAAAVDADDKTSAVAALESLLNDPDAPAIYRDLALLKSVMLDEGAPDARIARLQPLFTPGNAYRLLALEQRALGEIEMGDSAAAIETLEGILADAERTESLRIRASQLIVALGGTLDQG